MKPLHHPVLPAGPGHRSPQTLLLISERDRLVRTARRFFPDSMSDREIARRLRIALSTYYSGRWRRDRAEATCPARHRGKLTEILYLLLRVRDHVPSARLIRAVLSRA